jgi:serine/threonine protein kinase
VLLTGEGRAKVIDFGSSRVVEKRLDRSYSGNIGTPLYM